MENLSAQIMWLTKVVVHSEFLPKICISPLANSSLITWFIN